MDTSYTFPSRASTVPAFLQSQTGDSHKQVMSPSGGSSTGSGLTSYKNARNSYSMASPDQYTIAIVCAMMDEANPVQALFDDQLFCTYSGPSHDHNIYLVGRFAGHHAVLVTPGEIGELDTGLCTQRLRALFQNVELTLLVGTCGAVSKDHRTDEDVYLGDVIVGTRVWRYLHNAQSSQQEAGMGVQLELRNLQTEQTSERVKQLGNYCQSFILQERMITRSLDHLKFLVQKYGRRYAYPGYEKDKLFQPNCLHQHRSQVSNCECTRQSGFSCSSAKRATCEDLDCVLKRTRPIDKEAPFPKVHIGTIASADIVMRAYSMFAESFAKKEVLGIDMEGGGVSKATDCMVIKSAVDYADTHKNKDFRFYAAATAACFAKASLEILFQRDRNGPETKHLQSIISEAFKTANREFAKSLRPENKKVLQTSATCELLSESVQSIQRRQGITETLRGLNSIQPLIAGIDRYIQAAKSLLPIDLELGNYLWVLHPQGHQSSSSPIKTFERVTRTLAEIGTLFPNFDLLSEVCQRNEETKYCLPLFYQDILDLFAILLNFCSMTQTQKFHESLWRNSLRKIEMIRSNLRRHEGLVIGKADFSHIDQARSDRLAFHKHNDEQDFREEQNFKALRHELKVDSYPPPLPGAFHIERREWLRKEPQFLEWLTAKARKKRCIWVRGIPGSGKTFLTSDIIYQLQSDGHKVLHAFLSHRNQLTYISVLQSFLFQAVEDNVAYRPMVQDLHHEQQHADIEQVKDLLSIILNDSGQMFVAIDGLDEVEKDTGAKILTSLLDILSCCPKLKLLFSSRDQFEILQRLEKSSISLRVDQRNNDSIDQYTRCRGEPFLQQLEEEMGVDKAILDEIKKSLTLIAKKANGMFLYARLVMDVVTETGSIEGIRAQIRNLPEGLSQAYYRILVYIQHADNETSRSVTNQILQWLVCARCDVREKELLQALAVTPLMKGFGESRTTFFNIRKLCGPIVESKNGVVQFVHFSAKEYLLHQQSNHFIIPKQAHFQVAIVCLTYLSFPSFDVLVQDDNPQSSHKIRDLVLGGHLVLFQFAATQWLYHVKECLFTLQGEQRGVLHEALSVFFGHRSRSSHFSAPLATSPESLASLPIAINSMIREAQLFTDMLDKGALDQDGNTWATQDPTNISTAFLAVRNALEASLDATSETYLEESRDRILKVYGANLYCCKWAFCSYYRDGFSEQCTRQEHLRLHSRPYKCLTAGCIFSHLGFRTKELLARHSSDSHPTIIVSSANHFVLEQYVNRMPYLDSRTMLSQAVVNNQLNSVLAIFGTDIQLAPDNYASLLIVAAQKASGKMIDIILDNFMSSEEAPLDLNRPINVAVQGGNLSTTRSLLSRDANGYNQASPINKAALIEGALKAWDAKIMGVLVDEFFIGLPLTKPNDLFSDIVKRRQQDGGEYLAMFTSMKKYIIWPNAYTDGVTAALELRSPACLTFFLQNGGDPNNIRYEVIWRTVSSRTSKDMELVKILLRYGSDIGTRLQHPNNNNKPAPLEKFRKHFGMEWPELVRRLREGELLEGGRQLEEAVRY